MIPAPRTMTIVDAIWDERVRTWMVRLPGGVTLPARDEHAVAEIVRRHASGSAVRYVRGATEGELRELWGGR